MKHFLSATRAGKLFWPIVILHLLVIPAATVLRTKFQSPAQVLSEHTWGAGKPSSSGITAFATLRPWWVSYHPEAVIVRPDDGVEPLVRIPRSEIVATDEPYPPARSIGYDALLGWVTAARSLGSSDLVFDFALIVRLQQWSLVLALTLLPFGLALVHPLFRGVRALLAYDGAYLALLFLRRNRDWYLPDGLIDSALTNTVAVCAVAAFWLVAAGLALRSRKQTVALVAGGLFLGFCPMVRGEYFFINLFAFLYLAAVKLDRSRLLGLSLAFALMCAIPLANGLVNQRVFGKFVPLRLQGGQNLFEPIGQYPNPYGIQYDDNWVATYLQERGLKYGSHEADAHLTGEYFKLLRRDPLLFVKNLYRRLSYFSGLFSRVFHPVLLPVWIVGLVWWGRRDDRLALLGIPLALALGLLLFFGWTNNLPRLVAPVHFLFNAFLCGGFVYLFLERPWKKRRGLIAESLEK